MISWNLIDQFRTAKSKLVLLDYDGTLVPFESTPDKAKPTTHVESLLEKLNQRSQTQVIIITGRQFQSIDRFLGHLPITIIAEHGAMIKENGNWEPRLHLDNSWKDHVMVILKKWTLFCPNSFVENKSFSISWHYRNADEFLGTSCAWLLQMEIKGMFTSKNFKIIEGNKVVEIIPANIGKGEATEYVLNRCPHDYILSIGDDTSDEDMFRVLSASEEYHTVKVGTGHTAAKHRVDHVEGVLWLLETIANEV